MQRIDVYTDFAYWASAVMTAFRTKVTGRAYNRTRVILGSMESVSALHRTGPNLYRRIDGTTQLRGSTIGRTRTPHVRAGLPIEFGWGDNCSNGGMHVIRVRANRRFPRYPLCVSVHLGSLHAGGPGSCLLLCVRIVPDLPGSFCFTHPRTLCQRGKVMK